MNENGVRPYCKKPVACVAGTRGKCRLCHGERSARDAAIAAYHANGARTLKEVGDRFGISEHRTSEILRRLGVKGRKQYHRSHQDLSKEQERHFRTLCAKGIPAAMAHEEVRR